MTARLTLYAVLGAAFTADVLRDIRRGRIVTTRVILLAVLAVYGLAGCTITPADAAPTQTAPVSGLPAAAVATMPAVPVVPRTTLPAPTTLPAYVHPDPNVERWHALALSVGWPEAEWAWLSCVVFRESRGMPDAYNGRDRDRSYGLAQLNTKGALWGWFVAQGLTDRAQLFDPTTNLYAARAMFLQYGRKPWRADRGSCE